MSFDIHLGIFTPGYVWSAHIEAAQSVLDRYGARASDAYRSCSVRWEDGSGFAMYSAALFDRDAQFHALLTPLGGLSERFCDFTYDFAAAARCAICVDEIPPLTLTTDPALVAGLSARQREGKVVLVSCGAAIHKALAAPYSEWRGLVRDVVQKLNDGLAPHARRPSPKSSEPTE